MARKTSKRVTPSRREAFQPHDLLLAGIGAVSLGRKQFSTAYANGFEGVTELRNQARLAVKDAARQLNGKVQALQDKARAKAVPARKKFLALAKQARAQAESTLAPVLAGLNIKTRAKRSVARKPVARSRRKAA